MPAPAKDLAAPALELDQLSKSFGPDKVVDRLSLAISPGEFFSLLGPSGCGKTTTLRMIAGLETTDPDGGEIRIHGARANALKPYQRGIGMVFQSYALFPHLSVARNVAFGLEQQKTSREEARARVAEALSLVRLDPRHFGDRMPGELSGGQRQRVALARALVLRPGILLLDEPLGALDLKLRREMQIELKNLNRSLGITFVYVTHDQIEALTMSDRVAVMSHGRLAQIGTPAEVYQHPRNAFVASFIGEANILSGTVVSKVGSVAKVQCGGFTSEVAGDTLSPGDAVEFAVRPEWIELLGEGEALRDRNAASGTIRDVSYLGDNLQAVVALDGGQSLKVQIPSRARATSLPYRVGDRVTATWRSEETQALEPLEP